VPVAKRIFISYSREDEQPARHLRDTLSLLGYRVWFDQADLKLGDHWWNTILEGIRTADVVIVVASPAWLVSNACEAERDYMRDTRRPVLPVLVDQAGAGVLPSDLAWIQAKHISEIHEIKNAIDAAPAIPLPDPPPSAPEPPWGWQMVATAVQLPVKLSADVQNSVVGFLVKKARSPDLTERRQARRLAGEFLQRADLGPSLRGILLDTLGRVAVFPVIGAVLGGLALTHLLWVTSSYTYLDSLLDQLVGYTRGTARGVLAVNFALGVIGLTLCGVAVHRHVRTGRVGLALCLVAILGVVLDSVFKVQWPFG
jgi:hypothetical protein